jgi:hypothetical protein
MFDAMTMTSMPLENSVIAAKNMLVVNSTFSRTGQGTLGTGVQMGTPPMCGVDLEPDQYEDSFINVTFDSCRATENFGCGFAVALSRSTNATPPLSVVFRNCTAVDTTFGAHIKMKHNQSGRVSNITWEGITIVQTAAAAARRAAGRRLGVVLDSLRMISC